MVSSKPVCKKRPRFPEKVNEVLIEVDESQPDTHLLAANIFTKVVMALLPGVVWLLSKRKRRRKRTGA